MAALPQGSSPSTAAQTSSSRRCRRRGRPQGWTPDLLDYLYTSFTNATAFSPTDTMPLTASAKLLMMLQSLASLVTVAVVISRAVNILG